MALTLALAHKIAGMSIQIFLGFLVVRLGVMKFEDSKILSAFALYVVTPCAMLDAFQYPFSPDKLSGMGVSLLGSLLTVGVFALLGLLARRLLHWNAVETCSLEYPNAGNFMIPLVASVLGGEGLIYLSPCFILMNLLIFTHCQAALSGVKKFSFSVGKMPRVERLSMKMSAELRPPSRLRVVCLAIRLIRNREIAGASRFSAVPPMVWSARRLMAE